MTREEIDKQLQELKDKGIHHASKEFKDLKAKLESQLTEEEPTEETPAQVATEEVVAEPKPQPIKEEKPQKQEEKKMETAFDVNANYTFLLNRKENLRIIPREATVWDEEEGRPRKIRYVRTEESPYVDEQDENSVVDRSPIIFTKGSKTVSGRDKALLQYLLAYDGNSGKKKILPSNNGVKNLYTLHDPTAKARNERKLEEVRNKARNLVQEADYERLKAYIRSTYGVVARDEDEAKAYMYGKISTLPKPGKPSAAELILEDFNNPKHLLKAKIQEALQKGVIKTGNDKISVGATGALLIRYDSKTDKFDEVLANHILRGGEDAESIRKLINK